MHRSWPGYLRRVVDALVTQREPMDDGIVNRSPMGCFALQPDDVGSASATVSCREVGRCPGAGQRWGSRIAPAGAAEPTG
jgi:hypothetical protein